ncbi:OSCP-domain-containing protein [Thozetella sp. PMI_491]|nr:OSCP-domain-containing protein [Thozetella sp. PMI_491]
MLSRQALLRAAWTTASARAISVQTRSYAAAAATQSVKGPVAVFGLDGTYATALYTAAVKTSTLEPTARALTTLNDLMTKDPKLVKILAIPRLSAADRGAIVTELQKSIGPAGAGAGETVKNFLAALAENNRLSILGGVCGKFAELMSASRGEVEMTVTSAQQLDNRTLSRLETAVSKSDYVGQGKKLKVTNKVNPDIVGGLVVEIGDRTIDLSVSARIAKMNKLLTDSL